MSEDFPHRPDIPNTFEILEDGRAIKCLHCGLISYNANDVEHRYCVKCHVFHHDVWPPLRTEWIKVDHPH